jgi:hypothetical protein
VGDSETRGKLPDFVIIGTMKSGTASLFRWLGDVDGVTLPRIEEPALFVKTVRRKGKERETTRTTG